MSFQQYVGLKFTSLRCERNAFKAWAYSRTLFQ